MNCTICGQATLPGAMLCRPCKAALKRARYLSVQDLPRASILRPRRSKAAAAKRSGTGAVGAAAEAQIPVAAGASRPGGSSARQLLFGAGAIAVLALVAYFGQRHMGTGAADAAAPGTRDAPVVLAPLPPPAAPPMEPAAAAPAPPAALPAPVPVPAAAVPAPVPPAPKAGRVRPTAPPRPDPNAVAVTAPRPEVVEPVAPPPAPPPTPPPAPRPAPPPDRWQTMSNALAQCAREGGFGGFVCDQKVRLDSCEGYWGRVPQCPLPPENPGGQ